MVDVLYCDNHVLVLNKPAHLLTQPNDTSDLSLEVLGKEWIKKRFKKPGNVFLGSVHRLDRPVSGVVLFARTSKALSRLNEQLRKQLFCKEYIAIVEGVLHTQEGELEHYLQKNSFCTQNVEEMQFHAKKCLLKYRVQKIFNGKTLLRISLLTGRYHQIRAQLAAIGHPVLGDDKYGPSNSSKHLFLHHESLSFYHPITQEKMFYQAPLPSYWPHPFI